MFTGIIEEVGRVARFVDNRLTIDALKITQHLQAGDSVDVNGACLTVTAHDARSFSVDIMEETLARTTLHNVKSGDRVNLETALTLQKPLGGHLVQGHIDTVGEVTGIEQRGESTFIHIEAPALVMRYLVSKGFIAVNGISLTVAERNDRGFSVSIVKFSMANTTLGQLKVGDQVNLEADVIAKYVEQILKKSGETIDLNFLKEHGFLQN